MSIFDKLKNDSTKIEKAGDSLGGNGPLSTDVYDITVKMAYIDYSRGGAMSVNFDLETSTGRKLRSQQWVTSGDAKGNKHYYVDKRSGKNRFLPGYELVNDMCILANDTPLFDMDTETKAVKVYDFNQSKEVNVDKEVLADLIGQKLKLAVEEQIVDKRAQLPDGTYGPTGETRRQNEVLKAFHEEYEVTVTEAEGGLREATFMTAWREKNKGNVRDKSTKDASAPAAGAPVPPAASGGKSLFS